GHERRGADAEVHVRALGDVRGDARRQLPARDPGGHFAASFAVAGSDPVSGAGSGSPSTVTPPTNPPSRNHRLSPTATTRSTKMPGVTTDSGSRDPSSTISSTCTTVVAAAVAMTGPKLRAVSR